MTKDEDVERDKIVLREHGFPEGQVFFRHNGERYSEVAERVSPDMRLPFLYHLYVAPAPEKALRFTESLSQNVLWPLLLVIVNLGLRYI